METLQFNRNSRNIVRTNINYTYEVLLSDINMLRMVYPFLEIGEIGRSVLNKSIPYIRIGYGPKQVFYNGSFHANEWITTPVLMNFIEDYAQAVSVDGNLLDFNAGQLFEQVSLYIVPMVNPDGVDLVTGGLENVDNAYQRAQKIANDFPDIPFPSGWKANINGVDLKIYQPIWKFNKMQ